MKGTSFVYDYCHQFKAMCDKLSIIGHPVAEIDKLHWFLCGLGPSYETFSTVIRDTKPTSIFGDWLHMRKDINYSYNIYMVLLYCRFSFMTKILKIIIPKVEVICFILEVIIDMAGDLVKVDDLRLIMDIMHHLVRIYIHMLLKKLH